MIASRKKCRLTSNRTAGHRRDERATTVQTQSHKRTGTLVSPFLSSSAYASYVVPSSPTSPLHTHTPHTDPRPLQHPHPRPPPTSHAPLPHHLPTLVPPLFCYHLCISCWASTWTTNTAFNMEFALMFFFDTLCVAVRHTERATGTKCMSTTSKRWPTTRLDWRERTVLANVHPQDMRTNTRSESVMPF